MFLTLIFIQILGVIKISSTNGDDDMICSDSINSISDDILNEITNYAPFPDHWTRCSRRHASLPNSKKIHESLDLAKLFLTYSNKNAYGLKYSVETRKGNNVPLRQFMFIDEIKEIRSREDEGKRTDFVIFYERPYAGLRINFVYSYSGGKKIVFHYGKWCIISRSEVFSFTRNSKVIEYKSSDIVNPNKYESIVPFEYQPQVLIMNNVETIVHLYREVNHGMDNETYSLRSIPLDSLTGNTKDIEWTDSGVIFEKSKENSVVPAKDLNIFTFVIGNQLVLGELQIIEKEINITFAKISQDTNSEYRKSEFLPPLKFSADFETEFDIYEDDIKLIKYGRKYYLYLKPFRYFKVCYSYDIIDREWAEHKNLTKEFIGVVQMETVQNINKVEDKIRAQNTARFWLVS